MIIKSGDPPKKFKGSKQNNSSGSKKKIKNLGPPSQMPVSVLTRNTDCDPNFQLYSILNELFAVKLKLLAFLPEILLHLLCYIINHPAEIFNLRKLQTGPAWSRAENNLSPSTTYRSVGRT